MKESYIYNQNICIYTRVSWLHLTPTKMGLALHCHGDLKLRNRRMEEKGDTKRKKESFPQALPDLQALQNEFSCTFHIQKCLPFEKSIRNRLNLPHQHMCHSTLSLHRSTSNFASQLVLSVDF